MKAAMPGGPRTQPTSLTVMAKLWPTPRTTDRFGADRLREDGRTVNGRGADLVSLAKLWPTPEAHNHKGTSSRRTAGRGRDLVNEATSGPLAPTTGTDGAEPSQPVCLNPPFVEWLMGWPIGWTDCTQSATASFHSWLRSHSDALRTVLASTSEED
jgi:DNA (cytosine-5)-methyltransferase 1